MYTFLGKGRISSKDIKRLVKLSDEGILLWQPANTGCAYYAEPSCEGELSQVVVAEQLGANLRGIRLGLDQITGQWSYLRLTDHSQSNYYVDTDSPDKLIKQALRLYDKAQKAVRLGGTLKSDRDTMMFCGQCQKETPHRHLIDTPYGLAGAMMSGSERYACVICEHSISVREMQEV